MQGLRDALRSQLQMGPEGGLVAAAMPAPRGRAAALLAIPTDSSASAFQCYWAPGQRPEGTPKDAVWYGRGVAFRARATGTSRVSRLREEIQAVFGRASLPGELRPWVRAIGGVSFSAPRPEGSLWGELGEAELTIPEVIYVDRPEGALLIVVSDAARMVGACERAEALLAALEREPTSLGGTPVVRKRTDAPDRADFEGRVRLAQACLRESGSAGARLEKVVLARRVTLELSERPSLSEIQRALGVEFPQTTRFVYQNGSSAFTGATPERLILKRGRDVETDALAGTIGRQVPGALKQLIDSPKERWEHQLVVQAIAKVLHPLCDDMSYPGEPGFLEQRHLVHLWTPMHGHLRENLHVLDLVERLHPTPAVAGWPSSPALAVIDELEDGDRGWYAAPFGWLDSEGSGEFVVALRSALLQSTQMHLYAGAGILQDSEPSMEYDETELKLQGILATLGLSTRPARPSMTSSGSVGAER